MIFLVRRNIDPKPLQNLKPIMCTSNTFVSFKCMTVVESVGFKPSMVLAMPTLYLPRNYIKKN